MKKMIGDGNLAAAQAAYLLSETAAVYPITPSTPIAENCDEWARQGQKNVFGQQMTLVEMQSEGGAAGALHGLLSAGALASTFTASQGLLLMLPDMCKMSGELLPGVIHVAARALAYHALSIFGDHSDVMTVRAAGWGMLCGSSVQEASDLAVVAHLTAMESSVPMLHFFDGFRTSHEIQRFDALTADELKDLVPWDKVAEFRARAMNPDHPHQQGTSQNPDIYFQGREAANPYFAAVPAIVQKYMDRVAAITGRPLSIFSYTGDPAAEKVIVIMGSGAETVEETVRVLMEKGEKVGVVRVRLFRPFSAEAMLKVLPETVKSIAVLDRTKESGSQGEPLYLDVCTAIASSGRDVKLTGGRYGLGSKEFTPAMVKGIYDAMDSMTAGQKFTIGIDDDVTKLSLPYDPSFALEIPGTIRCKFYGLGSDGTVGANKASIKLIAQHTDKHVQAYFSYDSKKSGGYTVSHLRVSDNPIHSPYLIGQADFLACHQPSLMNQQVVADSVKEGGRVLLNLPAGTEIPARLRKAIATKHAKLWCIDADAIAAASGLGGRINTVMQTSFFLLNDFLPEAETVELLENSARKAYAGKGDKIVADNISAIEHTREALRPMDVPAEWADLTVEPDDNSDPAHATMRQILAQQGDKLPVSAIDARGFAEVGTSKLEKRGIARQVPAWDATKCIGCGLCSLVCPHAAIRTFYPPVDAELPEGFTVRKANGKAFEGRALRVQVSPMDCTGCASCVNVCPAKEKALTMEPAEKMHAEQKLWDFALTLPEVKAEPSSVQISQAKAPLFEFSGACAGCGETPYVKLLTQLFGSRLMVANATGCSSIYAGSAPSCPYTVNSKGQGPAWGNSLFEDNAEFGYGLYTAMKHRRADLAAKVEALIAECPDLAEAGQAWLDNREDAELSETTGEALVKLCAEKDNALAKDVAASADLMTKKSVWLIGGDGWAFDIGYGGLDHVLASGENVNALVLNTEVYSNTGGQASKATPKGASAKLMSGGKTGVKKDLGMMAMTYGHVYVAQVAMGANPTQLLKAMREAEAWNGPSLIIAYAPCISHGIDMSQTQSMEKEAVQCGYFPIYRFDPTKEALTLDCAEPKGDFQAFLLKQRRFASLQRTAPEASAKLRQDCEVEAKRRWRLLNALTGVKAD